jgi:hypothetical protein
MPRLSPVAHGKPVVDWGRSRQKAQDYSFLKEVKASAREFAMKSLPGGFQTRSKKNLSNYVFLFFCFIPIFEIVFPTELVKMP